MKKTRKNIEFINATCASRTVKLIGSERMRRMLESESLQSAFEILRESSFGGDVTFSYQEYEKVIEREEELLCEFVKEYAPSDELEYFCLIEKDFYNLEVMLKCNALKLDSQRYTQTAGVFSIEQLTCILKGEKTDVKFPKELIFAAVEGAKLLDSGEGGMALGALFTRKKYAFLKRTVKTDYLKKFLNKKIDGVNLCTLLRSDNAELAKSQIIEGGSLTDKHIEVLLNRDKDAIATLFANSWLKDIAISGVKNANRGEPLIEVERFLSSVEIESLNEGRYTQNDGTYPFSLYYFKRKNEIACVRTILTGKANGLEAEQIKRRLITV